MVVQVGVMELPVTEDPDDIQTYMNGEHTSGGLWTALTRASDHDHSGGLSGVQLGSTSIPDGSITTAKLDPAVLLPYALVDGSKPFTGQVSMNADAVLRDTLYFGEQGTALPADATLARTGPGALRADTHLGVGVTPAAWAGTFRAIQLGERAALYSVSDYTVLAANTINDGASKAVVTGPASYVALNNGSFTVATAPSVAAGAAQTFTPRALIGTTGTLTLTPATGNAVIDLKTSDTSAPQLVNTSGSIYIRAYGSNYVAPHLDNNQWLGAAGNRWMAVYSVNGALQTSSSTMKEGITPLDPAACYQAAKDVRWYEYSYLPPAYQEPEPVEGEDADTLERRLDESKAAHLKMVAETAPARHQRGFVFPAGDAKDEAGGALPPVPALFGLDDRQSTTPQADLATLGCAVQEIIRRLEALEGAPAR